MTQTLTGDTPVAAMTSDPFTDEDRPSVSGPFEPVYVLATTHAACLRWARDHGIDLRRVVYLNHPSKVLGAPQGATYYDAAGPPGAADRGYYAILDEIRWREMKLGKKTPSNATTATSGSATKGDTDATE